MEILSRIERETFNIALCWKAKSWRAFLINERHGKAVNYQISAKTLFSEISYILFQSKFYFQNNIIRFIPILFKKSNSNLKVLPFD